MSPVFARRLLVVGGIALAIGWAFVDGFTGAKLAWCVGAALVVAVVCVFTVPLFRFVSKNGDRPSGCAIRVAGVLVGLVLVVVVGGLMGAGIGVVLGGLCAGFGLTAMVAAKPSR